MNYLSHLYLSQRTPESYTGNLMGDFKPSPKLQARLPEEVLLGIENHRLVDRLTDKFEAVKQLRRQFSPQRRRFAGIITDIAFDYFLIKHWDPVIDGDFDAFERDCYHGLARCEHLMPDRMAFVTGKMREHAWLGSYASLDGISKTIDQVGKRLRFENSMAGGIEEVERLYDQIESVSRGLFEHLKTQVRVEGIEQSGVAGEP